MHDNSPLVEARIARFINERITPAIHRRSRPLSVTAWFVPDEPVPFAEAVRQNFVPFEVGGEWGKPWGTVWFHITGEVPSEWHGEGLRHELVIDLGFSGTMPGFQAEGTVYRPDGTIVKAIEPRNRSVPLGRPGSPVDLYLEAAGNPDTVGAFAFAPTRLGDRSTAGDAPAYRLRQVDAAALDVEVWELAQDLAVLTGLLGELSPELPRRAEVLRALEDAVDIMDPHDVAGTASAGRAALADVLSKPAHASAHRLHAVGHAHIDSAWLWPVRETVRKVARTFSNVVALMEENEEFVFAASSAQQYAWLKESHPELFERVKKWVAAGRFVPVGGMWVESDTNMPGGEAMARQFVAGKRFFMEEFGIEPLEVWLPDSFGYSAALPQLVTAAGSRWLLTQKMSWNETNAMPHHTFSWEGIDGTRVFTHFPPVDTYSAQLNQAELARAQRNFAEKGRANTSLVPFGWGDGGGGPTREMIAAGIRSRSLEGSPTVTFSTPERFFTAAEEEYPSPPVWAGELYLEFHRGTYTSQSRTKRGNRRSEHLLREAELWATLASLRLGEPYPYDALESAWRTVLLQQFHDILPGSSIAWVHQEAERKYAAVAEALEEIIAASLRSLAGEGDAQLFANAGPYSLGGVGPSGIGIAEPVAGASIEEDGRMLVLQNSAVRATIDERGLLTSLWDVREEREVVPAGSPGNLLQLFRDTPTQWDAWDIDEHYKRNVTELVEVDAIEVAERGPERVSVRVTRSFGSSTASQLISLHGESPVVDISTTVDWHEKQKLLKLGFPLDVHADHAASEIQFGHVIRPTHTNTSWDVARFETVAHRWVQVGEPGYGVAIANDSSYGYDIGRLPLEGGGTATRVRVSLLRAPVFPDPESDQGEHTFAISVHAGASIAGAVADGYRLNLPLRPVQGAQSVEPLLSVDNPAVVIEAVKLAEDRSGDVIVRLYEAHGSRARATLIAHFDYGEAFETDLLERVVEPAAVKDRESGVRLELRAFQLVTLRFKR